MSEPTRRRRVLAALRGEKPVDRVPISLWRHFGGIDMTVEGLVSAMVDFQRAYDFDFVKFMPTGTYGVMDWGVETVWEPHARGTRTVTRLAVAKPSDWASLRPLDVERGTLGMVNQALRETIGAVGPDTPVLQTIFSPLTTAIKLAGPAALAHLRQEPERFERGLETIAETTERLLETAVAAGADVFYALQTCGADVLTLDEVRRWEAPYARRLLSPLGGRAIVLVHAHGDHLWFDEVAGWPVDGVNWHDRRGGPSLARARRGTAKGLVGGLDGYGSLRSGPIADVEATVADAMGQVDRGLIVSPGCVIPADCPPHLIRAARGSVERRPARPAAG